MGDIDREEKDLLTTYELDEWQPVANRDAEMDRYREYARATFEKEKRVNIHVSGTDLEALQRQAVEQGVPCEALMSSVIHKYASGRLIDGPPPV
jgi:predicted DNA binding CopG/RHH family protein